MRRFIALPFLVVFLLQGCATPGPAALRHPAFRPAEIRRPFVVLQVSLEHTGFIGEGEFSAQERASIPEALEIALLEALNAEGIIPGEVTLSARRSSRDSAASLEGIDRKQALERARALKADVVMILDVSLSRRDLVYCREERRRFVARTTLWALGAEVLRVADGARLLVEPPGPALRQGDVEPECDRGRVARRLSAQELVDRVVERGLSLLLGR